MQRAKLICHPSTRCDQIDCFHVQVHAHHEARLSLKYTIEGDLSGLLIPGLCAPSRAERLWQHTCCEAFLTVPGRAEYYEFNFSPSTRWAIYRFDRYREGMALVERARPPELAVRCTTRRLELDAVIGLDDLSPIPLGADLSLGVAAVVEETGGHCSYWALHHPADKPDFHHPGGFAVRINRP